MSNNLIEAQHKRIVALSAAALVFGLYAIKQTSHAVWSQGLLASILNQNLALMQFGTSVIVICVVVHMMMQSFETSNRSRYLERHDRLTGLPNRQKLFHKLSKRIADENNSGALMLINPGRLRSINTSMGRDAGDAVFLECANRLNMLFEKPSFVAVSSEGTLAIYIQGIKKAATINALSEQIACALKMPINFGGRTLFANHSAGAVLFSGDSNTPEELLNRAELALLESKVKRGDQPEVFNASMHYTVHERGMLETELQEALENGHLERFYQPLFSADGRTPVGFEALARWKHPQKGWISPATFIPIAESLNLSATLGRQIMEKACAQISPLGDLTVSVNVTPSHLLEPDFVNQVGGILERTGMPAHRLELEITESVLLEETEKTVERINELRSIGVAVALDDFGTGYSGLSYLNRFSVDRIKIDASFIREISASEAAGSLVETIISLAQDRGFAVTVEGVETAEQHAFLKQFDNLTYQGYFFGPPMAYEDLLKCDALQSYEKQRFEKDKAAERPSRPYANLDSVAALRSAR